MKKESKSIKVDETQEPKPGTREERIYQDGKPAIYKEYDENGDLIGGGVIVEDRKYAVTTPKEGINERLKSVLTSDGHLNGEFKVMTDNVRVGEVSVYRNGVEVQQEIVVRGEGSFEDGVCVSGKGIFSKLGKIPRGNDR